MYIAAAKWMGILSSVKTSCSPSVLGLRWRILTLQRGMGSRSHQGKDSLSAWCGTTDWTPQVATPLPTSDLVYPLELDNLGVCTYAAK